MKVAVTSGILEDPALGIAIAASHYLAKLLFRVRPWHDCTETSLSQIMLGPHTQPVILALSNWISLQAD